MDYPELQRDVLEIFVEAQHEASSRHISMLNRKWGDAYRAGRFGFPVGKTEFGQVPPLAVCIRCRKGFTFEGAARAVHAHQRFCPGAPPKP